MKKFISILLALVMVFALSTVAFAEETEPTKTETVTNADTLGTGTLFTGTASCEVKGGVQILNNNKVAAVIYSVTVTWTVDEIPTPKYNVTDYWKWDPETLKYVEDTQYDAIFSGDEGALEFSENGYTIDVTVEIENRSNADVDYTLSHSAAGAFSGIQDLEDTTTKDDKTGTLKSADTEVNPSVHSGSNLGPSKIEGTNYDLSGKNLSQAGTVGTDQQKTINAKLHFSDILTSGFGALTSESTISYGTYTVTLSEHTAD